MPGVGPIQNSLASGVSTSHPPAFNRNAVVAVCFAIAVLEGYDIQSMGVTAPAMARSLHIGKDQIGFAGSAAMVGLVIGAWLGGWLADRFGRKPVLIAATVCFGLFSLATALASDVHGLIAARLATGLGFGGAMPNMLAVAAEISSPSRRTATGTAMFAGFPAGGILAALVTVLAPAAFDWRLIFVIGGALPMVLAPVALWLLPETRVRREAERAPSISALTAQGRAITTLLIAAALGFTLVVQYLMLSWLPTLAIASGMPRPQAAMAAAYYNAAGIAGGLLFGVVVDRCGARWPITAAYAALAIAIAALGAVKGLAPILLLSSLTGFLLSGGLFCVYALAPTYYPAPVRATGTGVAVGVGRIGAVAGPSLGGFLLAGGANVSQVIQSLIPIALAGGVAAALLTMFRKPYGVSS